MTDGGYAVEISEKKVDGITVIALAGSIDAASAPKIADHIQRLANGGDVKLVADFGGVDYTSSAGLRVLLGAIKDTRSRNGDMRLAAVQPDVLKVLSLSGFTSILKLYDDVASAVASFA